MPRVQQQPGIRPRATIGRRLDVAARLGFPAACALLPMLVAKAPFNFTGQAMLLPAVTLVPVWFWSLYRPRSMPPLLVFGLGLLLDLLGSLPLGIGVLTLLCVHGIALKVRHPLSAQRFVVVWLVFSVAAAAAAWLMWMFTALLRMRLLPFGPAVFQAVLTAALYPVLAVPFAAAHRSIADPELA